MCGKYTAGPDIKVLLLQLQLFPSIIAYNSIKLNSINFVNGQTPKFRKILVLQFLDYINATF